MAWRFESSPGHQHEGWLFNLRASLFQYGRCLKRSVVVRDPIVPGQFDVSDARERVIS